MNDGKYLFKQQYDFLKYQFNKILSEYNTSGNLHSIRHTFITKMRRLKNESASKIKKSLDIGKKILQMMSILIGLLKN